MNADLAVDKGCEQDIGSRLAFISQTRQMPLVPDREAELDQLADGAFSTKDGIGSLRRWHKQMKTCRDALLIGSGGSYPFLFITLVVNAHDSDLAFEKIIEANTGWGSIDQQMNDVRVRNGGLIAESLNLWLADQSDSQAGAADNSAMWHAVGEGLTAAVKVHVARRRGATPTSLARRVSLASLDGVPGHPEKPDGLDTPKGVCPVHPVFFREMPAGLVPDMSVLSAMSGYAG